MAMTVGFKSDLFEGPCDHVGIQWGDMRIGDQRAAARRQHFPNDLSRSREYLPSDNAFVLSAGKRNSNALEH